MSRCASSCHVVHLRVTLCMCISVSRLHLRVTLCISVSRVHFRVIVPHRVTLCISLSHCALPCHVVHLRVTLCISVSRCASPCHVVHLCVTLCISVSRCASLCPTASQGKAAGRKGTEAGCDGLTSTNPLPLHELHEVAQFPSHPPPPHTHTHTHIHTPGACLRSSPCPYSRFS